MRHGTVKPLGPGFLAPIRRARRNRVTTTRTRTKATPHATAVVLRPGWKINSNMRRGRSSCFPLNGFQL